MGFMIECTLYGITYGIGATTMSDWPSTSINCCLYTFSSVSLWTGSVSPAWMLVTWYGALTEKKIFRFSASGVQSRKCLLKRAAAPSIKDHEASGFCIYPKYHGNVLVLTVVSIW